MARNSLAEKMSGQMAHRGYIIREEMELHWSKIRQRFELQFPFLEREEFQRILNHVRATGFIFDSEHKIWHGHPETAAKVIQWADSGCREMLNAITKAQEDSLSESRATNADLKLPVPEGLEYFPFQKAGIGYALKRDSTLFGDEMGLGKTIQALGWINYRDHNGGRGRGGGREGDELSHRHSILVICPASLKLNWAREAQKWLVRTYEIGIGSGKDVPDAEFLIINYDVLRPPMTEVEKELARTIKTLKKEGGLAVQYRIPELKRELSGLKKDRLKNVRPELDRHWNLVIADECQMIKNPKSQRTKMVEKLCRKADHKLFLTGTPLLNRPIELYPILQCLDPERWPSYFAFAKRYCNAHIEHGHWDFKGATRLDELQVKLRETIMVRRLKKDVLKELPPKIRQIIELENTEFKPQMNAEAKVQGKWVPIIKELTARVAEGDTGQEYAEVVKNLSDAKQTHFSEMSRVRHETALAKVPRVVEHIRTLLEEADKIVVFGHHRDVIEKIRYELQEFRPVVVTGKTPPKDRQAAVDRFQTDPSTRIYIGSILVAQGITLTAASVEVFAELDWVPGNMNQAEDRCHRIGQQDSVLVHHVVVDGSLDATLAKTLVRKQKVINKALDDNPETADAPPQLGFHRRALKPAGSREFSSQERRALHEMLQLLSGFCDGASSLDDRGFNKADTDFGKGLAAAPGLSQKQAYYAQKMLKKYRRQIPLTLYEEIFK